MTQFLPTTPQVNFRSPVDLTSRDLAEPRGNIQNDQFERVLNDRIREPATTSTARDNDDSLQNVRSENEAPQERDAASNETTDNERDDQQSSTSNQEDEEANSNQSDVLTAGVPEEEGAVEADLLTLPLAGPLANVEALLQNNGLATTQVTANVNQASAGAHVAALTASSGTPSNIVGLTNNPLSPELLGQQTPTNAPLQTVSAPELLGQQTPTNAPLQTAGSGPQATLNEQLLQQNQNATSAQALNGTQSQTPADPFAAFLNTSQVGTQNAALSPELQRLQNAQQGTLTPSNVGDAAAGTQNTTATATGDQFTSSTTTSNAQQANPSGAQQLAQLLSTGGELSNQPAQTPLPTAQQPVNTPLTQQNAANLQFSNAAFNSETLPHLTAQFSRNIAAGRDSFNVRLNPSELGRIDVRLITNDDGSVQARVQVERVETLDLLQRDARALERSLQQSGLKLGAEGLDLSLKDNGSDARQQQQAFDGNLDGQRGENSETTAQEDTQSNQPASDSLLVDDLPDDIPADLIQTIYAQYRPGQLNIRV